MGLKQFIITTKKKKLEELWLKMSDTEIQLRYSNIADAVLKRTRKHLGKKNKIHYRRRKRTM